MVFTVKVLNLGLVLIRDVKLEGGRQRHPSGGVSAKEMVIGLEGVELGADGKVRSRQTHHLIVISNMENIKQYTKIYYDIQKKKILEQCIIFFF